MAGGRIAFSSNRNGFVPPRGLTNPTMQLFVMDEDGGNVTQIAPMNIGSALHPTPLVDGRLLFSSLESQGLRDGRMWGIWSIWPDGRHWDPVVSAFLSGQAFHFMTQLSNTDLVVVDYYNLNNNGFGALFRLPVNPPANTPRFYPAFPDENPAIQQTVGGGFSYPFQMAFTPYGLYSITPFTHGNDEAAPIGANGTRVGKFTHPSAAPNNDLLVVWSPGPCNDLNRPTTIPYYDAGLYLIPNGNTVTNPNQLVLIKNDPNYNEAWPRAVVPYSAVHGVAEPFAFPWLPNDGSLHAELPAGTPYGLVGTSSVYKRESFPGFVPPWSDTFDGLDAFNTAENGQSSNWEWQGSDAGKYDNSDIWAIRIIGMEPNTHRSYGPNGGPSGGSRFFSHANEKLRILGEIPLRKTGAGGQPVLDPEGNPDTSFLVKVPADSPFTFQTLDRNGMVLNMAQTWHQVRPGEVRNDCGGCHAHSQLPLAFDGTAAAQPGYQVADLNATTPLLSRDAQRQPQRPNGERAAGDGRVPARHPPAAAAQLRALPHQERAQPARRAGARQLHEPRQPAPGRLRAPRRRSGRRVGLSAARHRRRPGVAADQRQPLRAHVPEPAQSADVEALRPAPRRLDQRRSPDRVDAGQSGDAARRRRRQPGRPRLHRVDDAAAGQRRPAAQRRREDAVRALDRSRVPDRLGSERATAGFSTTCARAST